MFVLHDDGYGRVVIEVRRRADDKVVAVSAPALAFSTLAGFQRSAGTLRWRNTSTVEVVPRVGLFGDKQGLLSLDLTNPGTAGNAEPGSSGPGKPGETTDIPAITVQVCPTPAQCRIADASGDGRTLWSTSAKTLPRR